MPGDGIGPEVISAGIRVLSCLASTLGTFSLEFTHFPWSSDYYLEHGTYLPKDAIEQLKPHNAILFGSVGHPDVPDHISLWGLRLALVQGMDLYANIRPTRLLRGITSPLRSVSLPTDLDMLIIRENSEGEYSGHGGRSHINTPLETGTEVSIFTRAGVERIMRFAFAEAARRPRKRLIVVTKSNAQRYGMVMWDAIAAEVAEEFASSGVKWEKMLVDAMTARMVLDPKSIDTVVATNLHADIISDLAAALAGSMGVAPTGNLDPERRFPSLFEPIHGSAFDLVGKGLANPVATFWTGSEMLKWLGEEEAAEGLMECVESVLDGGVKTRDLGGKAGSEEVTSKVCEEIERRFGGRK
jgi:tartrate dehydrogenase